MDHKKVRKAEAVILPTGYKLKVGDGLVMSIVDDNQITIGMEPMLLKKLEKMADYMQPPR